MRHRRKFLRDASIWFAALLFAFSAQAVAPVTPGGTVQSLAQLKSEYKRPNSIPFPSDNPYSDAKAALGQMLFDGSIATLRDSVVHYDTGFVERPSLSPEMHRLGLSEQEVQDIVALLETLTSRDDPVTVPMLPVNGFNQ
jgi:hypothetical protein